MESEPFDKRMALEVIEDAFTTMETPEALGFAVGLCGAFYMCGLLEEGEWRELLRRIPASSEERCMRCKSRHEPLEPPDASLPNT